MRLSQILRTTLLLVALSACAAEQEPYEPPTGVFMSVIVQNEKRNEVLVAGAFRDRGEVWYATLGKDSVSAPREVNASGTPVGGLVLDDGTVLLAVRSGGRTLILQSSADRKEWNYPKRYEAEFRSFDPDGSVWILENPQHEKGKPVLAHLALDGSRLKSLQVYPEQEPAVNGEFVLTTNGYSINRFMFTPKGWSRTDAWEVEYRNYAFMPKHNLIIVSGGEGVVKLEPGKPGREVIFTKSEPMGRNRMEVTGQGDVIYVADGKLRFMGFDGKQMTTPLQFGLGPFQSPEGPSFGRISQSVVRRGEMVYLLSDGVIELNLTRSTLRQLSVDAGAAPLRNPAAGKGRSGQQ